MQEEFALAVAKACIIFASYYTVSRLAFGSSVELPRLHPLISSLIQQVIFVTKGKQVAAFLVVSLCIGVGAPLAMFVFVGMKLGSYKGGSSESGPTNASAANSYLDTRLITTAERAVTSRLVSPSTASFPGAFMGRDEYVVTPKTGGSRDGFYLVTGVVDSQNNFGAIVRSKWLVALDASDIASPKVLTVAVD